MLGESDWNYIDNMIKTAREEGSEESLVKPSTDDDSSDLSDLSRNCEVRLLNQVLLSIPVKWDFYPVK